MRRELDDVFDEEKNLRKWRDEINKKEVQESQLEEAIFLGFERAKQAKQKRRFVKRSAWTTVTAVLLMFTFIISIRVSPVFANAIASIPGMSGIVDLIQDNKGLQLAIDNEHYQMIGLTEETESIKITLEGIITDETSLVAFSTIENKENAPHVFLSGYRIVDKMGREIPTDGSFNTTWNYENDRKAINTVEVEFNGNIPNEEMVLEYRISEEVGGQAKEVIKIPFTVDLKPIKKEHYVMNQTAVVEGQKINIRSVTIGTLKTAIEVEYDGNNSMKIFGFEDLRLEDENGEVWSSIENGIISSGTKEANVYVYYLQSNYFKERQRLTLKFNKLMALDKDQAEVVIDIENKKILNKPNDGRFNNLQINGRFINLELKGEKGYHHDPFSTFYDGKGKKYNTKSGSFSNSDDETIHIGMELPDGEFTNPLRFPLEGYPSYIEGNVEITIQ